MVEEVLLVEVVVVAPTQAGKEKQAGKESFVVRARSAHWIIKQTSTKEGRGHIIGMKEACFLNRSLRPTRRTLMSWRSSIGSPICGVHPRSP